MNKLSNYRFVALALLCCAAMQLHAQDPRERHYYYEVLEPKHEYKPKVDGYATERITEKLNRGLTAVPAKDGKAYISAGGCLPPMAMAQHSTSTVRQEVRQNVSHANQSRQHATLQTRLRRQKPCIA